MDMELVLLVVLEYKLSLPDSFLLHIDNIVIVDDFAFGLSPATMCDEHKLIRPHFPHGCGIQLHIVLPIGHSDFIGDSVMTMAL